MRYRRSRYLRIRSELNSYILLRWLCVPHSQLAISGFLRLLGFSLSGSAILSDTLCSLGQNCRFQLEGDRYCSILLFVDSIISIDRKLITFDTGFIRYNTASQSVITFLTFYIEWFYGRILILALLVNLKTLPTSLFYSGGITRARNNNSVKWR